MIKYFSSIIPRFYFLANFLLHERIARSHTASRLALIFLLFLSFLPIPWPLHSTRLVAGPAVRATQVAEVSPDIRYPVMEVSPMSCL